MVSDDHNKIVTPHVKNTPTKSAAAVAATPPSKPNKKLVTTKAIEMAKKFQMNMTPRRLAMAHIPAGNAARGRKNVFNVGGKKTHKRIKRKRSKHKRTKHKRTKHKRTKRSKRK